MTMGDLIAINPSKCNPSTPLSVTVTLRVNFVVMMSPFSSPTLTDYITPLTKSYGKFRITTNFSSTFTLSQ